LVDGPFGLLFLERNKTKERIHQPPPQIWNRMQTFKTSTRRIRDICIIIFIKLCAGIFTIFLLSSFAQPQSKCMLFFNYKSSPTFGQLFPQFQINFDKKTGRLNFFTNSSGHPAKKLNWFQLV
jgi:hypothetical protein